jgi:hypothetical protein
VNGSAVVARSLVLTVTNYSAMDAWSSARGVMSSSVMVVFGITVAPVEASSSESTL